MLHLKHSQGKDDFLASQCEVVEATAATKRYEQCQEAIAGFWFTPALPFAALSWERDISVMDALWLVLALGFPRRPHRCAGSCAGRAGSFPLPCKVIKVTAVGVGQEGHKCLEDF